MVLPVLLAFGGCAEDDKAGDDAAEVVEAPKATALEEVRATCSDRLGASGFGDYVTLGDEGHSAMIGYSGTGDIPADDAMYQIDAMDCLLSELDVTDAIEQQMGQTTAMMGRQEASWDQFTISWAYHPDNGVTAVVTEAAD